MKSMWEMEIYWIVKVAIIKHVSTLAEQNQSFNGGIIVEKKHILLSRGRFYLICPNYNDNADCHLVNSINRLTALYRKTKFYDKTMFYSMVSGLLRVEMP